MEKKIETNYHETSAQLLVLLLLLFSVKCLSQVFFRKQQTQSGSDLNLVGNGFTLRIQEPHTSTKTYLDIKSAHWGSLSATNKHRNFGRPVKTGVWEHSNEQSWSRSTFFMLICFGQRISTTSLLTPRSEREIGARAVGSVANETLCSLQLELGNQRDLCMIMFARTIIEKWGNSTLKRIMSDKLFYKVLPPRLIASSPLVVYMQPCAELLALSAAHILYVW